MAQTILKFVYAAKDFNPKIDIHMNLLYHYQNRLLRLLLTQQFCKRFSAWALVGLLRARELPRVTPWTAIDLVRAWHTVNDLLYGDRVDIVINDVE